MSSASFATNLSRVCSDVGIQLTTAHALALARYYTELCAWNRVTNLTAITDPREVMIKHFVDSLLVAKHLCLGPRLFDIGAGAGFPGLPLALHDPDLRVTLCESRRRRCSFMRHLIRQLGLDTCQVLQGRAEAVLPAQADTVISRAFAAATTFLPLARMHLSPGGKAVCMAGRLPLDLSSPVPQLALDEVITYELPAGMGQRHLIVYADVSRETLPHQSTIPL